MRKTKRQSGRGVRHAHQQPAAALQGARRVFQKPRLGVPIEVVQHVEEDDHIGRGQRAFGYVPGFDPDGIAERDAPALGDLLLQLDAM